MAVRCPPPQQAEQPEASLHVVGPEGVHGASRGGDGREEEPAAHKCEGELPKPCARGRGHHFGSGVDGRVDGRLHGRLERILDGWGVCSELRDAKGRPGSEARGRRAEAHPFRPRALLVERVGVISTVRIEESTTYTVGLRLFGTPMWRRVSFSFRSGSRRQHSAPCVNAAWGYTRATVAGPLAACAPDGMAPSCHWEADEPWQTCEGEPSKIKRIAEESPAAARGEEVLHKGECAVTITYRVFDSCCWGHIVGVLDAGADFDVQQQKGGRAWGIAAMGCGFVETRNAFRRDAAKSFDFDQKFTRSEGLVPSLHVKNRAVVKKVEGFRISIHINWPERQLYFSIAGGAYCSNPHPGPHHNPGLGPDPNPNPNPKPNPNPRPNQMGPTISRQGCSRLTCGACGLGYRPTASTPPSSCRPS